MSLFSLRKPSPQPNPIEFAANTPAAQKPAGSGAVHPLDALTGGAFSAPTSGERAARLREWLGTEPTLEQMNEVFKEFSQRDRGAAKLLKEKLDEIKRQKLQQQIAIEWMQKAQHLLAQPRLNLADALAWQRDAARAGAPLSRDPLAALKLALTERVKAIEDLQHRVQVQREAAVLLAQRIEVLSTKPWREAQHMAQSLRSDVAHWQQQAADLPTDPQWPSVEPKFPPMLEASRSQLQMVWEAFDAALAQAVAADAQAQAALPAVPVWADELRAARGQAAAVPSEKTAQAAQATQALRERLGAELERALDALEREIGQGHGKATPQAAAELRALLKRCAGVQLADALQARAHAALTQADELEGWQRWRADQLRNELLARAEALLQAPEGQRLGGRKMQETLRELRQQWKATDQGGVPNHALWKRFDEACTQAHQVVENWLTQWRQQADAQRAQRLALIDEVKAWTALQQDSNDKRVQLHELHAFSERWRSAGHLSEKAFAELQPLWKAVMQDAHAPLEAAQSQSTARRRAMIEEATALGAAQPLHIDAVRALQQRWQAEAQAVPLERKHEQQLWQAFRQPIDAAFARKSQQREQADAALGAHDQRVLTAARALEAASASGDAQQVRAAMAALDAALLDQPAPTAAAPQARPAPQTLPESAAHAPQTEQAGAAPAAPAPSTAAKKVQAVRGDDRPGMKKTEPVGRDGQRAERTPGRRDAAAPRRELRDAREEREPRGPRLGEAAFRAQRHALEQAQMSLRQLAEQAHGEVLSQLLSAWERRDAQLLPPAAALAPHLTPALRADWAAALAQAPAPCSPHILLRLEMAAELPTPAEHLSERRLLQLQLLTQRKLPSPAQTWAQDVSKLLASGYDAASARRLQNALKALLKR